MFILPKTNKGCFCPLLKNQIYLLIKTDTYAFKITS